MIQLIDQSILICFKILYRTCSRACFVGHNCAELPLHIKTFIRSRRRTRHVNIPITINSKGFGTVLRIDFQFKNSKLTDYLFQYFLKRESVNIYM